MDRSELSAWLRLVMTPGLGRRSARQLMVRLGSPQQALEAGPALWRDVLRPAQAAALEKVPADLPQRVDDVLAWLHTDASQRAVIPLGDARYPGALLDSPDPPLVLFAQGQLGWLGQRAVALVGSRNASDAGLEIAYQWAQALSHAGWAVVSGLARGIDAQAHRGALLGTSGTIAVMGSGPDVIYPSGHRQLAQQIAAQGLLLSEYPPGTGALPSHFPQRNRIITGLCQGTVVIEAQLQSGSLISARLALESNREVMAVPGSIHNPNSQGCHALIKQGAALVESVDDIRAILGDRLPAGVLPPTHAANPPAQTPNDSPHAALEQALGNETLLMDELAARTGLSAAELQTQLLELELTGRVRRHPGQRFERTNST